MTVNAVGPSLAKPWCTEGVEVPPSARRSWTVVGACLVGAVMGGCGSENSEDAAQDGLRDWLTAARAGDSGVCELEDPESRFNAELLVRYPALGGPDTTCAERAARMGQVGLPSPGAAMEVPVWDPSGEALVEVATDEGALRRFWMVYDDGRWLVAGESD